MSARLVGAADRSTAGVTKVEFRAVAGQRRSAVVTFRRTVNRRVWSFRRMPMVASWTGMCVKSC